MHGDINLGIAVDLDFEGLLVPVIHQADGKRLRAAGQGHLGVWPSKARSRKLTMDDISGGTFTITNAGPFGTLITVPVINQPQVAILSTDGVKKRPVVVELPDGSDGIAIHPVGQPGAVLGPSGVRRGLRGGVPGRHQGDPRRAGLGCRAVACGPVSSTLRARWLGRVRYRDALALQRGLWGAGAGSGDWLLLLEHPHTYTLGVRAEAEHVLVDPASVGAELVSHRPGRRRHLPRPRAAGRLPDPRRAHRVPASTPRYVWGIEQLVIDALGDLGLPGASRLDGYPGVWVGSSRRSRPREDRAIGVRVSKGRSMHGFALNVDPDLT